jgi:DNA polymerase-3 subunit beta
MEGEYFSINFTEPTKAMTVKPESTRDYYHIIMPMQPNA